MGQRAGKSDVPISLPRSRLDARDGAIDIRVSTATATAAAFAISFVAALVVAFFVATEWFWRCDCGGYKCWRNTRTCVSPVASELGEGGVFGLPCGCGAKGRVRKLRQRTLAETGAQE